MAKGELYNIIYEPCGETGEVVSYLVIKFEAKTLIEVGESYRVRRGPGIFGCNCWAGRKPTCRHREMVELFIDAKAINTPKLYDYDNKCWSEKSVPSMLEEE